MLVVQRLNCSHAWLIHWLLQFRGHLNLLIHSQKERGFGHLIQFWSQFYMFSYKGICFKCLLKHLKHIPLCNLTPLHLSHLQSLHPIQNASCVISYPSSASPFLSGWNVTTIHCKCNRLTFLPLSIFPFLPRSFIDPWVGTRSFAHAWTRHAWYELQRLGLRLR